MMLSTRVPDRKNHMSHERHPDCLDDPLPRDSCHWQDCEDTSVSPLDRVCYHNYVAGWQLAGLINPWSPVRDRRPATMSPSAR